MTQLEKTKKIYEYNKQYTGELNQVEMKLIEEMAELTRAIIKYDNDQDSLLEEVADVGIMLNQYLLMLNSEKIDKMVDFKLDRTMKRLKIEEK